MAIIQGLKYPQYILGLYWGIVGIVKFSLWGILSGHILTPVEMTTTAVGTLRVTPEQKREFAIKYLESFSATKAMRAIGYAPKVSENYGGHLLNDPEVQQYLKERAAAADLTAEALLSQLRDMLLFDPLVFINQVQLEPAFNNEGGIEGYKFDVSQTPIEVRRILDLELSEGKGLVLKSPKRLDVIKLIAQIKGLFHEQNNFMGEVLIQNIQIVERPPE